MKFFALAAAAILSTAAFAAAEDNLKAFPPAEAGMVRYVLNLPQQPNEADYRVQLLVGKTVEVDTVNRFFFGGKIEAVNIEGWGFTRYVVKKLGPMAGTKMAPDPNVPDQPRFISLGGEPFLINYNSRLPIVVYVPAGVEVKYRIWSAEEEFSAMSEG
jgi:ecotin